MYSIRKITYDEVEEALALALEVFMQFEAPDYKPEGVTTFKRDIIENKDFISDCRQGICPIYAAFDGDRIVGIIGMRSNKTHINLVFTKKEYHHQGIATAIFNFMLEDILRENPSLTEITLNSSPYGKGFYLHIGFIPLSEEKETDGIRFTPMKYIIPRQKNNIELWDAYNSSFEKINDITLVRDETIPEGVFHLVCEILVKHIDGSYLLMRRDTRKHFGGMWEASAGGSALAGEMPLQCAVRELKEETGISSTNLTEAGKETSYETHSIYVEFLCVTDWNKNDITVQEGETIDYKWVSKEELLNMDKDELVTKRIQKYIFSL